MPGIDKDWDLPVASACGCTKTAAHRFGIVVAAAHKVPFHSTAARAGLECELCVKVDPA